MRVERVSPGDRAAVLDAVVDVWMRARSAGGDPPSAARTARVRKKVADPGADLWVARLADSIVGMLLDEPHRDHVDLHHVSMVFVAPQHQGRGLGRALLDAHGSPASLWTRDSNAPARALYRSAGFAQTSDSDVAPDGSPMHRWQRG